MRRRRRGKTLLAGFQGGDKNKLSKKTGYKNITPYPSKLFKLFF